MDEAMTRGRGAQRGESEKTEQSVLCCEAPPMVVCEIYESTSVEASFSQPSELRNSRRMTLGPFCWLIVTVLPALLYVSLFLPVAHSVSHSLSHSLSVFILGFTCRGFENQLKTLPPLSISFSVCFSLSLSLSGFSCRGGLD